MAYSLIMRMSLTGIYEPVENGWTQARIEEIPAVITVAPTLHQAKEMLVDALREYLLSLREQSTPVDPRGDARREPLEIVVSA